MKHLDAPKSPEIRLTKGDERQSSHSVPNKGQQQQQDQNNQQQPELDPLLFEDDGEDEQMRDNISRGNLTTNPVHIRLITSIAGKLYLS